MQGARRKGKPLPRAARKAARYRLGLSGTPMPHSPLDVYAYFRFIDATIFGWSYNRFRQHFAVMGGYQNHQVVAYDNLDELNRKFYSVAFACGKDVLDLRRRCTSRTPANSVPRPAELTGRWNGI